MTRLDLERPVGPFLRVAGAMFALALAAACGGAQVGPPTLALDRSVCDGCGMLISEPGYAAAYRAGLKTAVFDDIGCLLRSLDRAGLATDPDPASATAAAEVWFLDQDQHWTAAADAVFVRSPQLETPMGGRVQAFADRDQAEQVATRLQGDLLESFAELRATASAASAPTKGRHDSSG